MNDEKLIFDMDNPSMPFPAMDINGKLKIICTKCKGEDSVKREDLGIPWLYVDERGDCQILKTELLQWIKKARELMQEEFSLNLHNKISLELIDELNKIWPEKK